MSSTLEHYTDTVTELRDTVVRREIMEVKERIEQDYLQLAALLYEASEERMYLDWGFTSFNAYCEEELGIAPRKVQYMISIHKCIVDLGLEGRIDEIRRIGWTKMRMLVSPIRQAAERGDAEHIDQLFTRAESMSAKELQRSLTSDKVDEAESGETPMRISFTADPSSASAIFDAIDHAKREIDTESNAEALEHICYQYMMAGEGATRLTVEDMIQFAERTYGVKLTAEEQDFEELLK